jgi:MOSC domain-containing protein YiiM
MNLSYANLPPGTRVEVGSAVIEITAKPHTGCGKFIKRFGVDAQRFVNTGAGRELNLRGIYARIVVAGTVRTGDPISKTA